jgi:hypothetical protein
MAAAPRAFPGSIASLLIKGAEVAWATGVSMSEQTSQLPIRVLGSVYPQAHEATAVDVSGQFSTVRVYGLNTESLGLVQGSSDEVVLSPTFDVIIYDRLGKVALVRATRCRMTARSWAIDNGSVLMFNVSFVAIQAQDYKVAT